MPFGFPYKTIEELYKDAPDLPKSGNPSSLSKGCSHGSFVCKNNLFVQPMEGCDGTEAGAPTELTMRRYIRYAKGGAGLIWLEAAAVVEEGKANPRQLYLTEQNIDAFKRLTEATKQESGGDAQFIAQLTHSGRFSRPYGRMAAIRAQKNPVLDKHQNLPEDYPVITDEELKKLPEAFAHGTKIAMQSGFDGVDMKACHLYLMSELLGAFDREGIYGGPFENRVRLYYECLEAVKSELGSGMLASRLNLYDGSAAKWGVAEDGSIDWEEPLKLVRGAVDRGVGLINITMGTPYYNPHVNRPYATGGYEQPEIPAVGVARLLEGAKMAKKVAPECLIAATGFSYLRQFAPLVAAGMIERGEADLAGFGREAFAYPDFAKDILEKGEMLKEKCCVSCGLCTVIMRGGGYVGCPVKDQEVFLPELRKVQGRA